ncbi:hypothetical protein [Jannaschia sp. W003]|uniref:hypothetical protein n=1 Tax=Jannaschia sp. W003 TaxID=2867012 RepID=UPI0021A67B5E|nr:hypothetical protein [Jannaschia sp. W003]UWQ20348.1 hypothetical protein K3554_10100 [Jannaschia sp. W003]
MMIRETLTAAACALLALTTCAAAQDRTIRNTDGPAEPPPAGFDGREYVDSEGCVFIRAGVGDAVRYVPRVARDRSVVCGREPTFAGARPEAAPDAVVATERPAAPPAAAVAEAEPVIRRAPAPAAPRRIASAAPSRPGAPAAAVAPDAPRATPVAAAAAPARAVRRQAAVARRPAVKAMAAGPAVDPSGLPRACGDVRADDGGAARASRACIVALQRQGFVVRRAPDGAVARRLPLTEQTVVRVARPANALRVDPTTPSPRAAGCALGADLQCAGLRTDRSSRGVAAPVVVPAARTTFSTATPPRGYRMAWRDGRLNPLRGPRTLQGDLQSQAVWTNGVPRRLRRVIVVAD